MDIQNQLAQSIRQILSSDSKSKSTPVDPSTVIPKDAQVKVDQFLAQRTSLLQKLGAYSPDQSNGIIKGLTNAQSLIFRELGQFLHQQLSSNLSILINQHHPEAYLTALLIQSFGLLDEKLKERRKRQKHPSPRSEEKKSVNQSSLSEESAEQTGRNLLEALLLHTENHGVDSDFLFWAKKSLEQTLMQLESHRIELSTETSALFKMAFDAIEALRSGMSVRELKGMMAQIDSNNK